MVALVWYLTVVKEQGSTPVASIDDSLIQGDGRSILVERTADEHRIVMLGIIDMFPTVLHSMWRFT